MAGIDVILAEAEKRLGDSVLGSCIARGELTLLVATNDVVEVCRRLRDDPVLKFEQLIDLSGVDYSDYGRVDSADHEGGGTRGGPGRSRYAVAYQLLSVTHNHRLRLRVPLDDEEPIVDSVVGVWPVADWYEREAFDLFGIIFDGHPDLRRILTDYGFIGHPFRKDFPLTGRVEMRYDPDKGRVIYQPVTIEPRTLVPRIIREEDFGDRNP